MPSTVRNLLEKESALLPHMRLEPEELRKLFEKGEQTSGIPCHVLEKDYWQCVTLWAMDQVGVEMELKGGTSLSKGYHSIHRLSEDIDLSVSNFRTPTARATMGRAFQRFATYDKEDRRIWFRSLEKLLKNNIPGAKVRMGKEGDIFYDPDFQNGVYSVEYPSHFPECFGDMEKNQLYSNIILEVSDSPTHLKQNQTYKLRNHLVLPRKISPYLKRHVLLPGNVEWPEVTVNCIHPVLTVLQKIFDCLVYRFFRELNDEPESAEGQQSRT